MKISHRFPVLAILPALFAGLMPSSAYAADPIFNGLEADYPTLQVAKFGGQWQTSINAAAGGTLSLLVWEHNSVPGSVARNVRVKVNLPSEEERTSHTVTASISADNAATVTGSVAINTSTNTKLEFIPGSVKLYQNTGGENPVLTETSWPGTINPNNVVTTGINLGDQEGCWQFARAVLLQVRLKGAVVEEPHKATLTLKKEVRRTSNDDYSTRTTVTPGTRVQYRMTVKNIAGEGIAKNLQLNDFLPEGVTYVSNSAIVHLPDGSTFSDFPDEVSVIVPELKPGETVVVTFLADTKDTLRNCVTNRATVEAENTNNSPDASADVCFVVSTPTPPTPTPTPTPQTTLPKTGGEGAILGSTLLSGLGLSVGRFGLMKRKLRKQAKNVDIV
jgi:uncharacterized repeat protein (TIGR01451 family)